MGIVIRVVNCTDLVEYNTIGFSVVFISWFSRVMVGKSSFVFFVILLQS